MTVGGVARRDRLDQIEDRRHRGIGADQAAVSRRGRRARSGCGRARSDRGSGSGCRCGRRRRSRDARRFRRCGGCPGRRARWRGRWRAAGAAGGPEELGDRRVELEDVAPGTVSAAAGARPVTRLAAGLCSTTMPSASTATTPSSVEASQASKIPASTACMPPVQGRGVAANMWNPMRAHRKVLPDVAEIPRLHQPTRGGAPMSDAFLSSDDFDEQAHQLYNEGRYDEALTVLKEGIALYPHAVELHIGKAYAHLAREEFAWSRRSFDNGARPRSRSRGRPRRAWARRCSSWATATAPCSAFERILQLGLPGRPRADAPGRTRAVPRGADRAGAPLLRPGRRGPSRVARRRRLPGLRRRTGWATTPARSTGCGARWSWSRASPRRGSTSPTCSTTAARPRPRCTTSSAPSRRTTSTSSASGATSSSRSRSTACRTRIPSSSPGSTRLGEVAGEPDPIDMLLAEVEATQADGGDPRPAPARAVRHAAERAARDAEEAGPGRVAPGRHAVGPGLRGNWDEILLQMKAADREWAQGSLERFMTSLARRGHAETGVVIPTTDAEAFIRGSARGGSAPDRPVGKA